MSDSLPFRVLRFTFMTIDPVHIGTGGARLGRVDNSIVREPGTRIPKIPATSLSGAIRSYAAYRYGKRICAGQSGHCTKLTCPICYTFGVANAEESGRSGMISIGDARLFLYPIYSMIGPIWITSLSILEDFGNLSVVQETTSNELTTHDELLIEPLGVDVYGAAGIANQRLNLGWLMVNKTKTISVTGFPAKIPSRVQDRLVITSDKLFSQLVNSNLEVRTSVSIDPATGAAEDKALFTYEAIPRATFLWAEIVEDDFGGSELWEGGGVQWKASKSIQNGETIWSDNVEAAGPLYPASLPPKGWKSPADVVLAGAEWVEHLGVGGMGTRGFGRMRVGGYPGDVPMNTLEHNLDRLAARTAQEIIQQVPNIANVKNPIKTIERLATKALGVLQEQGIYALQLFLISRSSDEEKLSPVVNMNFYNSLIDFQLIESKKEILDFNQKNKQLEILKFYSDVVVSDLDTMFLVRDFFEQVLIYTRYSAKAQG